jgi:hypothetical protein
LRPEKVYPFSTWSKKRKELDFDFITSSLSFRSRNRIYELGLCDLKKKKRKNLMEKQMDLQNVNSSKKKKKKKSCMWYGFAKWNIC